MRERDLSIADFQSKLEEASTVRRESDEELAKLRAERTKSWPISGLIWFKS